MQKYPIQNIIENEVITMLKCYDSDNKNFIKFVYNDNNVRSCNLRYVGSTIDNLHYDFMKQFNLIPRDSVKSVSSMNVYQIS